MRLNQEFGDHGDAEPRPDRLAAIARIVCDQSGRTGGSRRVRNGAARQYCAARIQFPPGDRRVRQPKWACRLMPPPQARCAQDLSTNSACSFVPIGHALGQILYMFPTRTRRIGEFRGYRLDASRLRASQRDHETRRESGSRTAPRPYHHRDRAGQHRRVAAWRQLNGWHSHRRPVVRWAEAVWGGRLVLSNAIGGAYSTSSGSRRHRRRYGAEAER